MAFRLLETSLNRLKESFLKRSEGKLWILRAIRLLESSHKRLRSCRSFRYLVRREWFRMAFWLFENGFIDQQSRFLRRPEGRLWVLIAIRQFKTSCSERLGRALVSWNIEKFFFHCVIIDNRKVDATSWNGYTCGSLSSSSQIHVNYHLAISLRLGVRRADMVWF
jgi:hypothetical protein